MSYFLRNAAISVCNSSTTSENCYGHQMISEDFRLSSIIDDYSVSMSASAAVGAGTHRRTANQVKTTAILSHINDSAKAKAICNLFNHLLEQSVKMPPQHLLLRFESHQGKDKSLKLSMHENEHEDGNDIVNSRRIISFNANNDGITNYEFDIPTYITVIAPPSSFGAAAIVQAAILRYSALLKMPLFSSQISVDKGTIGGTEMNLKICLNNSQPKNKCSQIIFISLSSMFSILTELCIRDAQLCSVALAALLKVLEQMNPGSLYGESYSVVCSMYEVLNKIRHEGSTEVSSQAGACMVALATAHATPEVLLLTISSLLCESKKSETQKDQLHFKVPCNHLRKANSVQRIIIRGSDNNELVGNWWSSGLNDHVVLSSLEVRIPGDITPGTPDDRRLSGAIACDDRYIYALTCHGMLKLGTGLLETISGKLYACNSSLKANKGSWLTVCRGTLYLRRRQSSRIWVIDRNSLQEIGEIMLTSAVSAGALVSDGYKLYQINVDEQSNFMVMPLDDLFNHAADLKCQKYRLAEMGYVGIGDCLPIPHELILSLPKALQTQASDLQIGPETAFLLARSGKVYYAGNGRHVGLLDTNSSWMELVLPESIVSLSVGLGSKNVLLRSGSGHIWILGPGIDIPGQFNAHFQKPEAGSSSVKLRKFHTSNRRRCISLSASSGCMLYVTDNGKVFVCGRHIMHCNLETGEIIGLEGVNIASVALGKTHVVAVTRHGQLYTWGFNNLYQCGRSEKSPIAQRASQQSLSGNSNETPESLEKKYCAINEHLLVKDFASICTRCGECSARGKKCAFASQKLSAQNLKAGTMCKCGEGETCCIRCGLCRACGIAIGEEASQNDDERLGICHRTFLSPARLVLQKLHPDIKVSSVSCGNYHTIVLAANREVFAFGSNCHGQLGLGDTKRYIGPQKVELPTNIHVVQIATGANHTILRTVDGSVITFGAHRQKQLARSPEESNSSKIWHAKPALVPGYGRGCDTVATWIGANGDATIIHGQKRIFSNDVIANCQAVANKDVIIILPNEVGKDYVVVRRKQNSFFRHNLGPMGLYTCWCMESNFNLLWAFNVAEMRIKSYCNCTLELLTNNNKREMFAKEIAFFKAPEYFLPIENDFELSAPHMALSLLCSTYISTLLAFSTQKSSKPIETDQKSQSITHCIDDCSSKQAYHSVNRFDSFGGGWGYSAHSIEAIQFKASRDIKFLGVGLFGGRGEYIAKLKLYRLVEEKFDEENIELMLESDEMLFECVARDKARLTFARVVNLKADRWYIICAHINGPSSDCGANGKMNVEDEDGVLFQFRNSKMSNNGTDVNVGQIPELLFSCEADGNLVVLNKEENLYGDPTKGDRILPAVTSISMLKLSSKTFACCFIVLNWCIDELQTRREADCSEEEVWLSEKAAAVAIVCLKLICLYVRCLCPSTHDKSSPEEWIESSVELSIDEVNKYITQFAGILNTILEVFYTNTHLTHECSIVFAVLEEAVRSYIHCSHVLLPSASDILSRLMHLISKTNHEWSLIALFSTLCLKDRVYSIILRFDQSGLSIPLANESVDVTAGELLRFPSDIGSQRSANFPKVLRFLFEITFAPSTADSHNSFYAFTQVRLKSVARDFIIKLAQELVVRKESNASRPPIMQSPNRFRRTVAFPNWDVSSDAADAISIKVDSCGVVLHGIGIYCSDRDQRHSFTCEVLLNNGNEAHEQWICQAKVSGTLVPNQLDTGLKEISLIRLNTTVLLQPGLMYAIRLTITGGKTFCGEGGIATVRLCDGTPLYFQSCSLSVNGTSLVRGQIPLILYSICEVKVMQQVTDNEQLTDWFLLLVRLLCSKLSNAIAAGSLSAGDRLICSCISGYILVFLEFNPRRALDIVSAIDDLIPMIASTNCERRNNDKSTLSCAINSMESRNIQVVVESSHPYTPTNVHSQIVDFGQSVHFMLVQFSEDCETSQADDILWLYLRLNSGSYIPIKRFCGNRNWPDTMLLIPGSSLWFILETSGRLESATEKQMYGYRCTVTGFIYSDMEPNLVLEKELTWICASACRLLVQIPSDPEIVDALTIAEEEIHDVMKKHGSLLRKGLNLSHMPTVNEVLRRSLPNPLLTSDLKFLHEFIAGSSNTVAGFLANWMMSQSVVDCHTSQVHLLSKEIRTGVPVRISLVSRDQYGRFASCLSMKVEVTVRHGNADGSVLNVGCAQNVSGNSSGDSKSLLNKLSKESFHPVYINKARYMSITMMNNFSQFSFEEIRLAYVQKTLLNDHISMSAGPDGNYEGDWIPKKAGKYIIECKLDGFSLSQSLILEVIDMNDGVPSHLRETEVTYRSVKHQIANLDRIKFAVSNRDIIAKGIRVRSTPTLNGLQVGVIPYGHTVSYVEKLENEDGVWLRLSDEIRTLYCAAQFPIQAWCQQYSMHLGRHFLLFEDERSSNCNHDSSSIDASKPSGTYPQDPRAFDISDHSLLMEAHETYIVHDCCAIPLYDDPSLLSNVSDSIDASATLELISDGWIHNRQGIWVRLKDYQARYARAQNNSGHCFLKRKSSLNHHFNSKGEGMVCMKPIAQVTPRSRKDEPIKSIKPSVADCCRTVFAAFLWHEKLVKDAMVCSTYLKFHPELHQLPFNQNRTDLIDGTPLHSLYLLWHEVSRAVQLSIEQHLILPSPPSVRRFDLRSEYNNKIASSSLSKTVVTCELCDESHPIPITGHMRMTHAGCGKPSGGNGYNSSGKYTSGWSGRCGDGGRPNAAWYLMCKSCRSKNIMRTPYAHQQERNRRWREFRLSTAENDIMPEAVIKENAMFLLDLNCCADGGSKSNSVSTSGWTINLFPQAPLSPPGPHSACAKDGSPSGQESISEKNLHSRMHTFSHASDPGPKNIVLHSISPYSNLACTIKTGSTPISYSNFPLAYGDFASVLRHRLTDYCERQQLTEIVRSPSIALKSALTSREISREEKSESIGNINASLRRPVLAFIIERHDISRIREAMATAIARATFFSYSLHVWNWLLKLASSEAGVCDIIWQYLTALGSYSPLCKSKKVNEQVDKQVSTNLRLLPHPWRVCFLAGPIASKMVHQLHSYLYSVAMILQSRGVHRNLRSLCFRTWAFELTALEQDLLNVLCDVLATVGNVLSDPSSDQSCNWEDVNSGKRTEVKEMKDLSSYIVCETSSRQAMAYCLTDGNSETFWESGEEDKNKSRNINVRFDLGNTDAKVLAIYIDNVLDEGYRVYSISVHEVGIRSDGKKLFSEQIDHQFIGWIKCSVAGLSAVQVVLGGNSASVRVRMIRMCGFKLTPNATGSDQCNALRPSVSHQLLFSSAQHDAFSLFQAIATQAFSGEFSQEEHGTLRQQVLELLFSRVQLQPLQNYVCSQVVSALEREVSSLRDKVKINYSYVCGLMLMLIKICKSREGIEILTIQSNLLVILSELLLFAPQIVQYQIIETTEVLSRLFNPECVDCSRFVRNLLVTLAKVIKLQVKDKSTRSIATATLMTHLNSAPSYWRVDRPIPMDIGIQVKKFLLTVCEGSLNHQWAECMKTEIANQVMNFTLLTTHLSNISGIPSSLSHCPSAHLDDHDPYFTPFMKTEKFWLSVAALSVLNDQKWLELSSIWLSLQQNEEHVPRSFCDNHDDGQTIARFYCTVCQCSLCQNCFTVLHLKRHSRNHEAQIVGPTHDRPKIEIHEGCTRFRFSPFLVLFHAATLSGMVEYTGEQTRNLTNKNVNISTSNVPELSLNSNSVNFQLCRFCGNQLVNSQERLIGLCNHEECNELATLACPKILLCGHHCCGIREESSCMPCIRCFKPGMRQDCDDLCVVCFVDRLGGAPCVLLDCGHIFHYNCLKTILEKRWNGPRITFRFMHCPLCKKLIAHESLKDLLAPLLVLLEDVTKKASLRIEYEGLLQCTAITSNESEYYNNPAAYAMDRYMYVQCFKCNKAYFGGESRCQQALDNSQYSPEELLCGGCSDVAGAEVCNRHGVDYLEYKCRFCCSVAVYFCFGTTHFCAACHDDFQRLMRIPKQILPKCPVGPKAVQLDGMCPLKVQHPNSGEEFPLGCGICRNINTF